MIAVIPSVVVHERAMLRETVVKSLALIGVRTVITFYPGSTGKDNTYLNQMQALSIGKNSGEDTLFVEDDVIFNIHETLHALSDYSRNAFSLLYVAGKSFYSAAALRRDNGAGWYEIIGRQRFFGSQCVIIPKCIMPLLYSKMEADGVFLDTAISQMHDIQLLARIPNTVQHLSPQPLWSAYGKHHYSTTFEDEQ